jgi:hypothetical protein
MSDTIISDLKRDVDALKRHNTAERMARETLPQVEPHSAAWWKAQEKIRESYERQAEQTAIQLHIEAEVGLPDARAQFDREQGERIGQRDQALAELRAKCETECQGVLQAFTDREERAQAALAKLEEKAKAKLRAAGAA